MPDWSGLDSPTARALLALELIQNRPGVTADRLAGGLGVTERAARRYVAILREAGIPVESTRGPHGGYRAGRGLRLPPLMFSATEALGLVMAVLDGNHAADPEGPVGVALGKLMRVLPESVAGPAEAAWSAIARAADPQASRPDVEVAAVLLRACATRRRVRFTYRERVFEVDPWAVVVRRGKWFLLCWSHAVDARRMLRVDRVVAPEVLEVPAEVPEGLDPIAAVEEQLAEGWALGVEVIIEAPYEFASRWVPRSMGRLEPHGTDESRLIGSTEAPGWYARQLAAIEAPFRVVGSPELREAVRAFGERFTRAAGGSGDREAERAL